jgi:DNA topoisomerase-1
VPARKKQPSDAPSPETPGGATPRGRKKATTAAVTGADTPARQTRKAPAGGGGKGVDLVIVESPSKAKTINKYLGAGYRVLASMGHVRDLPKKKKKGEKVAGVDIDRGWKASYDLLEDRKRQVIEELKKESKKAGRVFLATDPDREGEAIAWHLSEVLKLDDANTFRITFNEITRQAVNNAISHPGKIDMDRVRAQEARRILDRVVGFPLSGLLNRKVKPRSSAGRVQSVALKLVVDREREIEAFVPQEYWKIIALLAPEGTVKFDRKPFSVILAKTRKADEPGAEAKAPEQADGEAHHAEKPAEQKVEDPKGTFRAELAEWNGKKFEVGAEDASTEPSVRSIATLLDNAAYSVEKVEPASGPPTCRRSPTSTRRARAPRRPTRRSGRRTCPTRRSGWRRWGCTATSCGCTR